MILGMSTALYTIIHVIISLIGIGTGFIVFYGLLKDKVLSPWNFIFLVTTILTNLTGFGFPNATVTPGIVIGVLSTIVLAVAVVALYTRKLNGGWRRVYAISSMFALYLNCFVLIAQLFEHVPSLHALAPTATEAPFKIAQFLLLALFIGLIIGASRKFRSPLVQS